MYDDMCVTCDSKYVLCHMSQLIGGAVLNNNSNVPKLTINRGPVFRGIVFGGITAAAVIFFDKEINIEV